MNKTSATIMGGALVIAIMVAMLVNATLGKRKETVPTTGTEVLVASQNLLTGEIVKQDNVHWESLPDNAIFKGAIKRKEQLDDKNLSVYGKPLRRDLYSGEPVTIQALVDSQSGNYLAASLQPGMRAVSIPIRAETSAGGFISPGDFVDVILTYQPSLKGDPANYADEAIQKSASETVLSNVRILAVDQNAKDETHEAKIGKTVTLEVNKEQAQIVAMCATMGDLSLALRRLGEKDTAADTAAQVTTDVATSKLLQKIYKIRETSKANAPTTATVRLYSGSNVENVPVRPTPVPQFREEPRN